MYNWDEGVTEDGSHLPSSFKLISLNVGEKPKGKRGRKPGTGNKKAKDSSMDLVSSPESKENPSFEKSNKIIGII